MNIFLSHSSADSDVAHSINDFLSSHEITVWMSSEKLKGGDDYIKEISEALSSSDAMIVLVSIFSTKETNWVAREVSEFVTLKKSLKKVIPILLDETNPDELYDGLGKRQHISFVSDHWHGYKQIAKSVGFEFQYGNNLEELEQRSGDERRKKDRRNALADRRHIGPANMARRMRKDLWDSFHKRHGTGKFENLFLADKHRVSNIVLDVFNEKYSISDPADKTGNLVELESMREIIDDMVDRAYDFHVTLSHSGSGNSVKAIHWIEEVANRLSDRFLIGSASRRGEERRTDEERRKS